MNCAETHEKIVMSVYGELLDDEAHRLSLHLRDCPECRTDQDQILALKTLASAHRVLEPDANLVARSRARLEESLDALPPKRWYDRLAEWMTQTATGLQSAPVAACLLLVAGAGLGSLGGYEFAARRAVNAANSAQTARSASDDARSNALADSRTEALADAQFPTAQMATQVSNVSHVVRRPGSDVVEVTYNQVQPRRMQGPLTDPKIRELLMLASQEGSNTDVRDYSVGLLAAECRLGAGCGTAGKQGTEIRDALMLSLRYDRSATVRQKALEGLQPFVAEDRQVRDAVLEALLNDPEARIRSAAISMLEPVEADTSVRQVLSTVAASDQNSHIRSASRLVLKRVSEIQ